MKIASRLLLIPTLFLVLASFSPGDTGTERRNKVLIDIITQGLGQNHFDPRQINDEFSERVFTLFLDRLDVNKRFLLQEDVDLLASYRDKIDEEVQAKTYRFFELADEILTKRILAINGVYKEILGAPFDFTLEDSIETDPEKYPYAKTEGELKEAWRKTLKYQTMLRLSDKLREQEEAAAKKDTSVKILPFNELESNAREKVRKTFEDFFRRMEKTTTEDRFAVYLNCMTNAFDPHTAFFPPKDKENFDISMSGQLEGIGATLTEKDGYIEIADIVPGSPSWKQGELEKGDRILKVGQGEEEPVDVVDMRLDNAVKLVRGKKGTEVRLTVKKIDGRIVVIRIIRDVVVLEETYAKSALLGDKEKIGYIRLPKFYADFTKNGARNCYEDVKAEVEKLNKESISGLILDLRDNGGGSLTDVVKIGGLFIPEGPIVQVKGRNGGPHVLKDFDPKTQYEGPLVILVNAFSASASEILAAAMQDYKRAVIVGTPSTFGKGTVQQMMDFDQVIPPELQDLKPLGAIKMTIQKFYRINGGTTQLNGVVSDVILPDNYNYLTLGEKELEYPEPWDNIPAADYKPWKKPVETEKLIRESKKRIAKNEALRLTDENAQRMKKQKDESLQPLRLEAFKARQEDSKEKNKQYREVIKKETGLAVSTPSWQLDELKTDTMKQNRQKKWFGDLKKDAQLFETVQIIKNI